MINGPIRCRSRRPIMGLAVAGCLLGTGAPAQAQLFNWDPEPPPQIEPTNPAFGYRLTTPIERRSRVYYALIRGPDGEPAWVPIDAPYTRLEGGRFFNKAGHRQAALAEDRPMRPWLDRRDRAAQPRTQAAAVETSRFRTPVSQGNGKPLIAATPSPPPLSVNRATSLPSPAPTATISTPLDSARAPSSVPTAKPAIVSSSETKPATAKAGSPNALTPRINDVPAAPLE